MPEEIKIDTEMLLRSLDAIHPPDKWAGFPELRVGTGRGGDSEQRFDYWAIHYYKSKQNKVVAYEIKASRSDFLHEIKKPKKRRAGLRLSNEFYFVCPKGMVKIEEIPVECGLMEVDELGVVKTIIKAPFRNTIPPTFNFMASFCRRLDKDRYSLYNQFLEEDGKLKLYGDATLQVIKDHIERWKSYNVGSKEVPDQIVTALESVYYDVIDAVNKNKKIK